MLTGVGILEDLCERKNGNIWIATLNIVNTVNGERILYDIDPIKIVERAVKSAQSPPTNSIPQNSQNATRKSIIIDAKV